MFCMSRFAAGYPTERTDRFRAAAINSSSFGVSNRIVDGKINADVVISGSSRH